ncbi:hypothetical protein MBM_09984 [Drepanopeziza brunnea f. sp. 'multigermtubi' MB_m1]|uniref:Uncharacterized protein n=1 Tax=Marssonina brunnea f. sp. multigermtubi (strain MB_m1) TaxID=1072389 RepID=K1XHA7_MARBU|nr:uncharacterized protein MBM_09984 [Drepanopeziza brunnea f. sp. 'multigermtubi' MB_m1]EKD11859.1 hypothetical protein MBM_09984 [Drepanopeziza brunnea f. sp. 'multigermtubi' MB_m1]
MSWDWTRSDIRNGRSLFEAGEYLKPSRISATPVPKAGADVHSKPAQRTRHSFAMPAASSTPVSIESGLVLNYTPGTLLGESGGREDSAGVIYHSGGQPVAEEVTDTIP